MSPTQRIFATAFVFSALVFASAVAAQTTTGTTQTTNGSNGCTSTTTTTATNGSSSSTTVTNGCGSSTTIASDGTFNIIVSPEIWAACAETIEELLPETVDETIDSLEACIIADDAQKALPVVVMLGVQAYRIYVFVFTRIPTSAYPTLLGLIANYRGPVYGDALREFSRDMVRLLRNNGFSCPSSTNVFRCRR